MHLRIERSGAGAADLRVQQQWPVRSGVGWSADGSMLAAGGGYWELSGAVAVLEAPAQVVR